MIIELDLNELNKVNMNVNQFLICYTVYQNRKDVLMDYIQAHGGFETKELTELQSNGWIKIENNQKITFENLQITEKFRIFVENKTKPVKEDWTDEWFNMFPKGIKSGGYYIKSDLSGCKKKLQKFLIRHPEFTPEIIMKATSNYIDSCQRKGYQYMKIAPYFIEKDGMSMLAGECEAILDNTEEYNNEFVQQI